MLTDSLGERKATSLLDRIFQQRDSTGIEALRWMDPRIVAEVVKEEHPQIIATILAHLDAEHEYWRALSVASPVLAYIWQ